MQFRQAEQGRADEIYQQSRQLQVELARLKRPDIPCEAKRAWTEPVHPETSLVGQRELPVFSRSGLYYQPKGESPLNLKLMRLLDERYTRTPFYGRPMMTIWCKRMAMRSTISGWLG